jgi:hypothetical protein
MLDFVQRHASSVIGLLSGFDRLLFRGTLRRLACVAGLGSFLSYMGILLKDFGDHFEALTKQVKQSSEAVAEQSGRPLKYLPDPSVRKEDVAKEIAERDGITAGLVCVLAAVEPCWSFEIHRNRAAKRLELHARRRRCTHLYHYMIHPQLGFMHVRLQTWMPFYVNVCVNGREWLARQMDQAGLGYARRDNCFIDLEDVEQAQRLMDEQLKTDWPKLLDGLMNAANPAHVQLFGPHSAYPIQHYWSVQQSELASDVMFKSPALLAELYPRLIRHGMSSLGSADVLRFLGKRVPEGRNAHPRFVGEVVSDLKDRPEGMRVKHGVNGNSVKMYDKQGSVLRVETTINRTDQFKVYRGTETEPRKKQWRRMRKGVADLHRRAEVSEKANERYLDALSALERTATMRESVEPLCRSVEKDGVRARGLRPFEEQDTALLSAVGRGEFAINGFRNRDVRGLLFGGDDPADAALRKKRAGQVTRKLRMLRAHGLIRKVPRTHRYLLTAKGRTLVTLLSAAKDADAQKLMALAA